MEYKTYKSDNGIRIIHLPFNSEISHCGFIINAGSRDELKKESGLAHFIEHVLFKGTKKRKAFHVLSRLESVGGELNAYTTKEETCIYASFLSQHYERAIEILADITFNSTFPDKEINKEKDVIIDEIASYQDNPYEQIHDDFEELLFVGNPLGNPVLGREQTIKGFTRENIFEFISKHYSADNIVFSSVGNIAPDKLFKLASKYINVEIKAKSSTKRKMFSGYKPSDKKEKKDTYQSHCVIGNVAYGYKDENRIAFILLNNLFGGPGMNSRLNLAIREKHGFTYNIESNYSTYIETGVFTTYLGTDPANLEKTLNLVYKELRKLRENKLGVLQLKQAKQQLTGQIAMAQENRSGIMLTLGKSLLNFGKVDSLQQIYRKIDSVSSKQILNIANEIFDESKFSTLIFNP